jgi:CubicO group peptidase (beta-lactamase class C family)
VALSDITLCCARVRALSVTLLFSLAATAAATTRESQSLHLQAAMEQALRDENLTGAVWALIGDRAVQVNAAGLKNARTNTQLSARDRVHVGSIAKVLLATGVLRLVTERRLALDTPIAPLLPQLAFENPWAASDPIRLRHLLSRPSAALRKLHASPRPRHRRSAEATSNDPHAPSCFPRGPIATDCRVCAAAAEYPVSATGAIRMTPAWRVGPQHS